MDILSAFRDSKSSRIPEGVKDNLLKRAKCAGLGDSDVVRPSTSSLMRRRAWLDGVVVNLLPNDAGTDSGARYTSANAAASPPRDAARIMESAFSDGVPLGTFRFTRTGG